jgi:hypothetical protein
LSHATSKWQQCNILMNLPTKQQRLNPTISCLIYLGVLLVVIPTQLRGSIRKPNTVTMFSDVIKQ